MMHPWVHALLARERVADLRRMGASSSVIGLRRRGTPVAARRPLASGVSVEPVTIRPAYPDDAQALRRLAALDSAALPREQLLVAEVEGELHAALSLSSGKAIADPFRPTAALVELLRARAAQLEASAGARGAQDGPASALGARRPSAATP